jgi:hypothetical protein
MSNRKILFIVEGKVDEKIFLNKMLKKYSIVDERNFYKYKACMHQLFFKMFEEDNIDDDFNIIRYLKLEHAKTDKEKETLSRNYTDIILVFDFDALDGKFKVETLRKAINFFNESTENGILYINYPQLEAYRHFKEFPDNEFLTRTYSYPTEIKNRKKGEIVKYKEIVGKESAFKYIGQYDKEHFNQIIKYTQEKATKILKDNEKEPNGENQSLSDDLKEIFEIQVKKHIDSKEIYVLATILLFIPDFNPKLLKSE